MEEHLLKEYNEKMNELTMGASDPVKKAIRFAAKLTKNMMIRMLESLPEYADTETAADTVYVPASLAGQPAPTVPKEDEPDKPLTPKEKADKEKADKEKAEREKEEMEEKAAAAGGSHPTPSSPTHSYPSRQPSSHSSRR